MSENWRDNEIGTLLTHRAEDQITPYNGYNDGILFLLPCYYLYLSFQSAAPNMSNITHLTFLFYTSHRIQSKIVHGGGKTPLLVYSD